MYISNKKKTPKTVFKLQNMSGNVIICLMKVWDFFRRHEVDELGVGMDNSSRTVCD